MGLMFAKCLGGAWLRGLCSHFPKLLGCCWGALDPFPTQQPIPARLRSPIPFPPCPQFDQEQVEMLGSPEGRPQISAIYCWKSCGKGAPCPAWGLGFTSQPLVPLHHLSAQLGLASLPAGEPAPFPVIDSRVSPPPSRLGHLPGCTGTEQVRWGPPD